MRRTLMPAERKPPAHSAPVGGQMAGLYDLEETLGKGHFAVVKAAKHVFTGERVAVKVIDKTKLDEVSQKALLKEVLCMKLVQHPNVVRLYEVIDTTTKMYLVLELGHGDLYDLILKQQGGLPEDVARKYFSQIVRAISFCHKLHVAHRDLKPENVVFFPADGQVKLTDFGFSNKFYPGVKLDTSCGSLAYSAPEILLGDAYDAPSVDIWSLGVILFMLVCGRAPFQEANDSETLTMIMDVKYSTPPHVSPQCKELIAKMLVRYPERRATLEDIEKDPWLIQEKSPCKEFRHPLISLHRLTNEEKNSIIQQMQDGRIATRDEVLKCLNEKAYNYVSSTFYLLAEKLLREREPNESSEDRPGTSSALTASLESLHDRRKNSGQSDTDEMGSGEDDSLAPLNLETKNSTTQPVKKSNRTLHTVLSSSALSDLDKALPILEEDVTAHSEVGDTTGPLPVGKVVLGGRRGQFGNRRGMVSQRSASCSSSEDEDSEKKKKFRKPKGRQNDTPKPRNSDHGESSDEQNGGAGIGSGNGAPLPPTTIIMSGGPDDSGDRGGRGGGGGGPKDHEEEEENHHKEEDYHHKFNDVNGVNGLAVELKLGEIIEKKKTRRLLFGWLFLRKKKEEKNNTLPATSGIYKTRSCAELKLKNGVSRTSATNHSLTLHKRDLNQNI